VFEADWLGLLKRYARTVVLASVAIVLALVVAAGVMLREFRAVGGWEGWGLERSHVVDVASSRLKTPSAALTYGALLFVYPIVAPEPRLVSENAWNGARAPRGGLMLSYDPWSIGDLRGYFGIAAAAWLVLLGCAWKAMRSGTAASLLKLLACWIVLNVAFHVAWGDEPFLYTPHWAFALFFVALLGARQLSSRFTQAIAGALLIQQVITLASIRSAADTILTAIQRSS
jgi:hypothetical protein